MSRADWLLVPLTLLAALPAAYLLSLFLAPDPTNTLAFTLAVEAVVALLVGAAVALDFGVGGLWHVSLWFLAFAAVDFVGIVVADEVFPGGGTASFVTRVAALLLGLVAARVATRRFSLERVRRVVDGR
ncbi:hypothetical protein [Halomarina litorea]|uniref:hypothetical protein n=1 Tax=Halomarina litorea TaxID=2961595 RepID=UPI0020C4F2A8|nr:hypothetical protein [Halomarina sp. BCD28]